MTDPAANQARVPSVMEDPSSQSVARVYADAFLRAAGDEADGLLEEFTSFHDDVLASQPEFSKLLLGGQLGRDAAVRLLDRTIAPAASPTFANFLRVLARHGRLGLIPQILHAAHLSRETAGGRRRVVVTAAVPLSDGQRERISERLRATLPFDPILVPKTDPKILGGLVIQVGDTVYDTSLRARLNQLRARMRQRTLHEIQRGRDRFGH